MESKFETPLVLVTTVLGAVTGFLLGNIAMSTQKGKDINTQMKQSGKDLISLKNRTGNTPRLQG